MHAQGNIASPSADMSTAEEYCISNDLLSNVLACVKFLCLANGLPTLIGRSRTGNYACRAFTAYPC